VFPWNKHARPSNGSGSKNPHQCRAAVERIVGRFFNFPTETQTSSRAILSRFTLMSVSLFRFIVCHGSKYYSARGAFRLRTSQVSIFNVKVHACRRPMSLSLSLSPSEETISYVLESAFGRLSCFLTRFNYVNRSIPRGTSRRDGDTMKSR